jgi:hypothetical protein
MRQIFFSYTTSAVLQDGSTHTERVDGGESTMSHSHSRAGVREVRYSVQVGSDELHTSCSSRMQSVAY